MLRHRREDSLHCVVCQFDLCARCAAAWVCVAADDDGCSGATDHDERVGDDTDPCDDDDDDDEATRARGDAILEVYSRDEMSGQNWVSLHH